MKKIAADLESLVDVYLPALRNLAEPDLIFKPGPSKWSKKEILGHLVDSAQSNIRRIVVAQYEETPAIVYDQDKWVAIANYQQYDTKALIDLWSYINKHMAHLLRHASADAASRTCLTQDVHTLEWLAIDYQLHLRHHIHQVLDLEPVPYP